MPLMQKVLLGLAILFFGILTGITVWHHGYTEVIAYQMRAIPGQQVFLDLSIALALIMVWMYQDAKNRNCNPWGWIVLTLLLGSFGPLFYLITRSSKLSSRN